MQMQLSFDVRIPDGLLAANALLNEKPHQGVPSWNLALHQGIDERNSTAAIGIRASAQLNRIWPRFTGKERDNESGLDYFGARYYASSMGRFMSPDWSAKAQAVPYAKLTNPQTLNLYGYMQNNPLGGVDQDGHCDWCQSYGTELPATGSKRMPRLPRPQR
jgi:RHS repeat-associated protein